MVCGALLIEGERGIIAGDQLPGRLGRRLWAYLVLGRRRPSGKDEIATALWGDEIPDAWEASVHALVSRVRRVVSSADAAASIRRSGSGYALELPPDAFVDRERAWQAIHHVRAKQRHGEIAAAWAEAVIAHEIAARGFLAGETGAWIEAERSLLQGTEVQALQAIAEAELALGRLDDAERAARRLVGLEPLRESGYRLLMRSLAAAGDRAAAAAVMEECRASLTRAGAVPTAETERVFSEAIRGPASDQPVGRRMYRPP